jgi:hypothetical protein
VSQKKKFLFFFKTSQKSKTNPTPFIFNGYKKSKTNKLNDKNGFPRRWRVEIPPKRNPTPTLHLLDNPTPTLHPKIRGYRCMKLIVNG